MPIHNGTHKGGPAAEGGRPTFVGGRPKSAPIMDGNVCLCRPVFECLGHHLGDLWT